MTPEQEQQVINLKLTLPFRIVYGALKDGEFRTYADFDKRRMKRLLRQGWQVWCAQ